jgi:large subunit ribosomal protein L24
MRKIKRNDEVVVIAGRDKGKRGEVLSVLANDRVLVSGVNLVKKHQRGNPNLGKPPGIVDKEAPIHISNVAIYNSDTGKPDRVRIVVEDGKRGRVFKSNGKAIDG